MTEGEAVTEAETAEASIEEIVVAEAAPEPVPTPVEEPVTVVEVAEAVHIEPEPVASELPLPEGEITAPPEKPKRGWWRLGR